MPTPQRLPIVNGDDGVWGDIIRQYLMKEHYDDGTDNTVNGGHQKITVRAGSATAGTAPIKLTSGTLMTTPEAGAIEFNGDAVYFTQTTGPTRKKFAIYDDASGATGDTYYRNSSGLLTRLGAGSTGDYLTIASGIPSWTSTIVGKSLDNSNTVTLKDTLFTLQDATDTTKQVRLDVAAAQTTGTTRTITLPTVDATLATLAGTETLTNKTLTTPKIAQIYDANNNIGLQISTVASAVNYLAMQSSPTGSSTVIAAQGTDTDINVKIQPKGAGSLLINNAGDIAVGATTSQTLTNKTLTNPRIGTAIYDTNGSKIIGLSAAGSAVNEVTVTNAPAGSSPGFTATGSDTDVNLNFAPKGAGSLRFYQNATGQPGKLEVGGVDANHDFNIITKGTGIVKANGVEIGTISGSQILTNKRLTPRVGTTASSATPAINTDNFDIYTITALATNITGFTMSGTPTDGQKLRIAITGTATRTIVWGSSFEASTVALPTTTSGTARLDTDFIWNTATSKWRVSVESTAGGSTFSDTAFTLQDDGDATKQAKFELSGIATGTTRTYTLPNATTTLADNATVVHNTGNETVAGNKNFTGADSFTQLLYTKEVYVEPLGGAGNTAAFTLDNDNGQVYNVSNNSGGTFAVTDATNAKNPLSIQANSPNNSLLINGSGVVVKDNYFVMQDTTDTTKQIRLDVAAAQTTGTTRTITLPSVDSTLTTLAGAETLTNKTLTSPRVNGILDTNGNKIFDFSAVGGTLANNLYIGNNTAGNAPFLFAGGTDTNVNLNLAGQGTGRVQINGINVPTVSSADTLTNKRITPRVGTTTSTATPAINTDSFDIYTITALATNITGFTMSGSPTDGQKLRIAITGTATRTIVWGPSFEASTIALPTTTSGTARLDTDFIWNAATSKWRVASESSGGGGATTFSDSSFVIQDNGDSTKQAKFEASGIATGTTQTYTFPNVSGTLLTSTNVSVADFAGSAIVTASEGVSSSNNDTSIPTTAAVINAIAAGSAVRKGTIMTLGDSLAAAVASYNTTLGVCSHQHLGVDYLFHGLALAGNPLQLLGSAATAGYTISQIISTHLPTILSVKPEYVLTWSLIGNGGMLVSGEFSNSLLRQIETDILAPIEAYGGIPILASFVPAANASNTGLSQSEVVRYNAWSSKYAAARGYPYFDFYSGLVDPSTGTYKSGYTDDNLHPNPAGTAYGMIPVVREWALRLPRTARTSLAAYNTTITGQSSNPLLAFSGDTPTGWTKSSSGGTSVVAAALGGRPGNRMLLTHGSGGAIFQYAPSLSVTSGDEWELSFIVDSNATGGWFLVMYRQDGSTVEYNINAFDKTFPLSVPAGTVYTMRGKVASGVTALNPVVGTVGPTGATVGISQWTFRNLTTMST